MGFEVPETDNDLEAVVDGVAAAAALSKDLPILDPGDDMLDASADASVCPVVIVAHDPAGVVAAGAGDHGDAAVSAVTEDLVLAGEQVCDGCAGNDDIVAVAGPALPGHHHAALVCADDDLGVDAAPVVLADGGVRLVVHRDQGAVDDPRVSRVVVWAGAQHACQHRHQVVDDPVHRRLAGVKQRGQCPGGQIGAQLDQQHPHR